MEETTARVCVSFTLATLNRVCSQFRECKGLAEIVSN